MGKQANALKHITDISPQLFRILLANVFTVHQDFSAAGLLKPVYHLKRRRLAAAGFADQAKQLAPFNTKRNIRDSKGSAAVVRFSNILQLNHGSFILTS